MTGKYDSITRYLQSVSAQTQHITLSFNQITDILGFSLPSSALRYQAWWAYEKNPKQPQKQCWQEIGWRVGQVDFSKSLVHFRRDTSYSTTHDFKEPKESDEGLNFKSQYPFEPTDLESDLSMVIQNPTWTPVFVIPKGTILVKGRHGLYHAITHAAAGISNRFGCYSWGSQSVTYYCGSFAQDYVRGNFKSNLQARIHNYLQNHRVKKTGQKNTNLMVFEKINETLKRESVLLRIFSFEKMMFRGDSYSFLQYCEDPDFVHLVEQLLITFYRKKGQCLWNRS